MPNIFVPLTGCENDTRALKAASVIASRSAGHIHVLHVKPDTMQIVSWAALAQFGSKMGNVELIHSLQRTADSRAADAAATFDAFLERHRAPGAAPQALTVVNATMEKAEGDPVSVVAARARYYDLVVLARARENDDFSTDAIANILVACGRPVVLIPDRPLGDLATTIAVAWKETPEAARAVTSAMPLLIRAKKVVVLSVAETNENVTNEHKPAALLANLLRRDGIAVEARDLAGDAGNATQALLKAAQAAQADLLVMGAYGHSRVRELIFGGFTRQVLKDCDFPVLMLH